MERRVLTMGQPLLSVIVPCYNVEKYVENCLRSILGQSYKNIEVICVDDASPDNSIELIQKVAAEDNRIKIIRHEKNRGLFHARLTGVSAASGDYIAFVDSDDYVSCDWFRPLVKRAELTKADVVLGNIVEVDENNWKHYSNICRSIPKAIKELRGAEVYRTFLKHQGAIYYWHVMWNKIYNKKFLEKVVPYFNSINENLTMTEDIAFSCVFYSYADNVQLVDNDCYFYCRHKEASTSTTLPQEKVINNLKDVIRVFNFFKEILQQKGIFEEVKSDYYAFKQRYFRIWCNNIELAGLKNNEEVMAFLLKGFDESNFENCTQYEFHLNSLNTKWDDRFENLKKQICDCKSKLISFDIFDTLLKRPLWTPDDVRHFIQYKVKHVISGCEEDAFIKMRPFAEQKARELSYVKNHACEDITLTEIYDEMHKLFPLSNEQIKALKDAEICTEKEFLEPRKSGKELYELARSIGKPVIIVSDMYIEEKDLSNLLSDCGYEGYHKLYVSSDYRKLKTTGNLFKIVLNDVKEEFGYSANEVLHIGDTWNNDIIMPRNLGMQACFLPKGMDVFTGNVGDIFNGNCTSFLNENLSNTFDTKRLVEQLPLRTMYGMVANNFFDNPFNSFQQSSRFNGDPYFMGYFALGTYLFSVAKWVFDVAEKNHYDRIIFIARDGYVVKKIFDMLVAAKKSNIASDYVYATRKSVLPYIMDSKEKFYYADNFINIFSKDYTYLKFLQLFSDVTNPLDAELKREYAKCGIILDECIGDKERFNTFISVFNDLSFNEDKVRAKRKNIETYFKNIFKGRCATFDVGYSGRIQKSLSDLCEKPIDALFLHDNGQQTHSMADITGFNVYSFYEYSPVVTDILREIFISETGPSCIGFKDENNTVIPVFDIDDNDYSKKFAIEIMQKGALDFANEFIRTFEKYHNMLSFRNIEAGYVFEYFCTNATEFDKYVFINHTIEDKVYSGFDSLSLVYRWNENLQYIGTYKNAPVVQTAQQADSSVPIVKEKTVSEALKGKSRLMKALYYFLFDRKTFKYKLSKRINKK